MIEIGRRKRNQPAPPHVLFEALTRPRREAGRPWLHLLDDETPPRILHADAPSLVIWSSLWTKRPDATLQFDLLPDFSRSGTDLVWTLRLAEPVPAQALIGHLRKRVNQLINAELRYSFGQ